MDVRHCSLITSWLVDAEQVNNQPDQIKMQQYKDTQLQTDQLKATHTYTK